MVNRFSRDLPKQPRGCLYLDAAHLRKGSKLNLQIYDFLEQTCQVIVQWEVRTSATKDLKSSSEYFFPVPPSKAGARLTNKKWKQLRSLRFAHHKSFRCGHRHHPVGRRQFQLATMYTPENGHVPKKGTISIGNTSSNHHFSGDMLVFRGLTT